MSKGMYHFCNNYDEWVDDLKNIKSSDRKIECDLDCDDCGYNDNIWVEEDD